MEFKSVNFETIGPKWMEAAAKQQIIMSVHEHTQWANINKIIFELNDCDGWEMIPQFGVAWWIRNIVNA